MVIPFSLYREKLLSSDSKSMTQGKGVGELGRLLVDTFRTGIGLLEGISGSSNGVGVIEGFQDGIGVNLVERFAVSILIPEGLVV